MCSEVKHLPNLIKNKAEGKSTFLKNIISFDEIISEEIFASAAKADLKIFKFSDIIKAG